MATLEVSLDKETMDSIKRSKVDVENGDFVDCSFDERIPALHFVA